MEHITKSLSAINRAFATLGKERITTIVNEIDSLEIKGPTVQEYFCDFESHFPPFAGVATSTKLVGDK